MVNCTDSGKPFVGLYPESTVSQAFKTIAEKWQEMLNGRSKKASLIKALFK